MLLAISKETQIIYAWNHPIGLNHKYLSKAFAYYCTYAAT